MNYCQKVGVYAEVVQWLVRGVANAVTWVQIPAFALFFNYSFELLFFDTNI